jgi:hypothetical protein
MKIFKVDSISESGPVGNLFLKENVLEQGILLGTGN